MHIAYRTCSKMLALLIVLSWTALGRSSALGHDETSRSYFPKPALPTRLYVIREADMTTAQETMISTLQGVVAKTRPEIYVVPGGRPSYSTWLT